MRRGMCNGTWLQITKLYHHVIEANIIAGVISDNIVLILRIPLTTNDDNQIPIRFSRLQFPIRPAIALTINKPQGQTLTTTGLYLLGPIFSHKQLYVAISRCSKTHRNSKCLPFNNHPFDPQKTRLFLFLFLTDKTQEI
jgi:ATP-dependent DNA helicase PIF1